MEEQGDRAAGGEKSQKCHQNTNQLSPSAHRESASVTPHPCTSCYLITDFDIINGVL